MKKLLILLFAILISFNSFGSIGEKYFCESKEEFSNGVKARFILEWNEKVMKKISIKEELLTDVSDSHTYLKNKYNYFVTSDPLEDGHFIQTFDGETFTTLYVKNSYTFATAYICTSLGG